MSQILDSNVSSDVFYHQPYVLGGNRPRRVINKFNRNVLLTNKQYKSGASDIHLSTVYPAFQDDVDRRGYICFRC